MKVFVILPAAGLGTRMAPHAAPGKKPALSKQFTDLAGTPILVHTLRKFVGAPRVNEIWVALRQSEIDEIRARIEAANGKEVPKVQYSIGEEVKINDGAFASLTGRIDEIDPDRGKLKVSVSIFGRFTPVELEYWQVSRVTE